MNFPNNWTIIPDPTETGFSSTGANEWSLTPGSVPQRLEVSYVYEFTVWPEQGFFQFRRLAGAPARWLVDQRHRRAFERQPDLICARCSIYGAAVAQALHVNVAPGVNPRVADPGPELWFQSGGLSTNRRTFDRQRFAHPRILRNPEAQNTIWRRLKIRTDSDRAFEFSAQAFDFINHANWNDPDNVIGPVSAP